MIENQLSTKFKGVYLGFSKLYQINDIAKEIDEMSKPKEDGVKVSKQTK